MSIHYSRIDDDLVMWTPDGQFEVDGITYDVRLRTNAPRMAFELRGDSHNCDWSCDTTLGFDWRDNSCKESGLPSIGAHAHYRWQPGDPVYIGATR